ncbi:MAG: ribonuclease III [Bacteroides sp.]|nr:ribonuclease III [Roseburia sp.]MCM1346881.1 ribonuclease III [Bacteroides sp.]MCM1421424.1 ribonuclease III [Bacteroides sp.]
MRLYDILGFYPHNIHIYQQALRHKSCAATIGGHHVNNERLEYLGDAVLGAVVADILYRHYKNKQEGYLTTLRSKLVKRETLNKLAVEIGLDKLVLCSESVASRHHNHINGNAFEAFFGAIYLDRGYDYCMMFMEERIFRHYINIESVASREENFKSKFIEWCQKYQLDFAFSIVEEKCDADGSVPVFCSEATIENVVCGRGEGFSKKESHQRAAQEAVMRIRRETHLVKQLLGLRDERVRIAREIAEAENEKQAAASQENCDSCQMEL